jgi:hypothetical protein
MLMAFLLVVIVDDVVVSDNKMLFRNIYRCNTFATAVESGKTSFRDKRYHPQQKITAYCVPRRVPETEVFYD